MNGLGDHAQSWGRGKLEDSEFLGGLAQRFLFCNADDSLHDSELPFGPVIMNGVCQPKPGRLQGLCHWRMLR